MFGRGRRDRRARGQVEFCDSCVQVCTPDCRADAHRDRIRAQASLWSLGPR